MRCNMSEDKKPNHSGRTTESKLSMVASCAKRPAIHVQGYLGILKPKQELFEPVFTDLVLLASDSDPDILSMTITQGKMNLFL